MSSRRSLLIASLGLALASLSGFAHAQTVTLKVHHFLPPNSTAQKQLIEPWCAKLAAESDNRLKCQIYPSMQLGGAPPQLFDQARDGIADIVWTLPTYQAGRFLKSEVFELPFMTKNSAGSSEAFWEYVQRYSLEEYRGLHLLAAHVHDGSHVHTTGKVIKTMEDMKGLKLRAPSRIGAKALAALGSVPIQMPIPQVPESLAKNVIDGLSSPWEVMPTLKLEEITTKHTETPPGQAKLSNAIFILGMNQARYDSLPADLRAIIDRNSGAVLSRQAGQVWDSTIEPARQLAKARGNTFTTLTDEEYQRWIRATDPVIADWIKEVRTKGADGEALLKAARALVTEYSSK
ncbi:TRAP transporter substrate-binding protein [Bosea sp. NPDC003192]|uniref:TRAP transporter substrate-binding protein n=1 Tax=Bosea sp. NPDC003192 TaxID=3390551 RepID=UPI003D01AA66